MKPLRPNDSDIFFALAIAFAEGVGVRKNLAKAVECLKMAAEMKHAAATYFLGYCYSEGLGVPNLDYKKAFQCFETAAKANVPEAMTALAFCYSHGLGVKRDNDKAFRFYTEAAKRGMLLLN